MSPLVEYPLLLSDTAYAEVTYVTEHGTLTRYSVVLIAWHDGNWHTVRVYDNAHDAHDMHRHTLSAGKHPAERFHSGTPGEAFRAALESLNAGYMEMIAGWLR
jgi:hypothetical protein